ncbi:MAG: hypothetical protein VKI42_10235 [Synechococcaceae cyanobacterium]|nr:hypothetical protein [Synechococcaceae cyanobacterium]
MALRLVIGLGFRSLALIHGLLICAAGAVAVVGATSWLWLDAVTAIGGRAAAMGSAWGPLREAVALKLDAASRHQDRARVGLAWASEALRRDQLLALARSRLAELGIRRSTLTLQGVQAP